LYLKLKSNVIVPQLYFEAYVGISQKWMVNHQQASERICASKLQRWDNQRYIPLSRKTGEYTPIRRATANKIREANITAYTPPYPS